MSKIRLINRRNLSLLALIMAGEVVFFLPFVLARLFRPTFLKVFDISNTELGMYFSVYGVVAMISYFFGGPLADRFSARYLLSVALWLTGLGGLVMSLLPSKLIMFILYGFFGMTTILLLWASLIRATREWGGTNFQGRAFGWLDGGRSIVGALLAAGVLTLFSDFDPTSTNLAADRVTSFQFVTAMTSVVTILCGVFTWFCLPRNSIETTREKIHWSHIGKIVKIPSIWLLSIIILCAYVGYKITDDYSLYAHEVLGFDEYESAMIGTASFWIRAVVAISVGFLADKWSASKVISSCFLCTIIGAGLVSFGLIDEFIVLLICNLALILIGLYGIRSLYFALVEEAKIPLFMTGTAVGIVSVIGFTPDIFMGAWMGVVLDHNPGVIGHQKVFFILLIFSVVGLLSSLIFGYLNRKIK